VANDDLKLKPGMTATVSVITDRRNGVLAVPNAALRFRPEGVAAGGAPGGQRAANGGQGQRRQQANGGGGGDDRDGPRPAPTRTVYVLVKGQAEPRQVTTGITDGRVTEI